MTITSMHPEDYIDQWNEMNKEFEEKGENFRLAIPTNEEVIRWLDQQDGDPAVVLLEQAAALLGGEITHFTCVDSSLRKCKKYVITYDRK